ncbi:MAG TPA: YraN family protein [Candidatus Binataceae bacterium]|nr:YraN family protein [Candidatus Binataceae bacterium]
MPYVIKRIIRAPYVYLGAIFDRWYEEMPWRKVVPPGRRGEQVAARHLKRCGYLILARNYRAAGAEIDLVALDESTLVFVEVKFRGDTAFGTPAEAVDHEKRDRIRRAARAFAEWRGVPDLPARFDVVALTGAGRYGRLELIRGAF